MRKRMEDFSQAFLVIKMKIDHVNHQNTIFSVELEGIEPDWRGWVSPILYMDETGRPEEFSPYIQIIYNKPAFSINFLASSTLISLP